ncbi:acyl carrier protein [Streptomyces sp. AK02-01A]|uniref:acyl carrier protein n=1 Tax=Streptomyces sp. AK02-01A TaxID=3028648 RepID=UPI0029A65E8D|nr:acyl carrier protein [Streptomyces sp. AK02-01A]MDX3852317.1 acyl carrier protein [Streptomyces sp. AK02-01A]
MNTTLERVNEIVLYVVPDANTGIGPADRLAEDLGIDSLSLVEILIQVEKRFLITVDDSDISRVESVQDILDLVHRQQ